MSKHTVIQKWLTVLRLPLLLAFVLFPLQSAFAAPAPQAITPSILWNQILAHQIAYIQEGHRGPIIYDFQDPNCPYCHVMYEREAPFIRAGKLTVRYVPVAFLSPQSPAEAAAWLQSKNPSRALQIFERRVGAGPDLRNGQHQLLPSATPTDKTMDELAHNLRMMQAFGFQGTPAIIFRAKNGKIGRISGVISRHSLAIMLPHLAQTHS